MSIVAFTFGSLGDIVTVLQLAARLRSVLIGARSASNNIADFIADIDIFTRALELTQATIIRRRDELQPDVVNGIAHAVKACIVILVALDDRMRAQQTKITGAKGAAAWKHLWTVAAWSLLGGSKEMNTLKARLYEQINVIQIMLALSQSNDQLAVHDALREQRTTLERLCAVVEGTHGHFGAVTPTFHFRDLETGAYFLPCARTSVQRLLEIADALGPFRSSAVMARFGEMTRQLSFREDNFQMSVSMHKSRMSVDLFFFPSDGWQWQVLIGVCPRKWSASGYEEARTAHIVRAVLANLERTQSTSVLCNCVGVCSHLRFQEQRYTVGFIEQVIRSYETSTALLRRCFIERTRRRKAPITEKMVQNLLSRCPHPSFLVETVIPKLTEYVALASDALIGHHWHAMKNLLHSSSPCNEVADILVVRGEVRLAANAHLLALPLRLLL